MSSLQVHSIIARFRNLCVLACMLPAVSTAAEEYDVVVYGLTSSGIAAAVQAKRMEKTVVVVGPDQHLGGLTAGGLGWTDSGNKNAIGGIGREFYQRIWKHYQQDSAWRQEPKDEFGTRNQSLPGKKSDVGSMWVFEPHVAEQVFEQFVREYKIPVVRNQWLDRENGVKKVAGRIRQIQMLSGETYPGKMFIDATYEGDLMAAAGVDYHVGREANSVYNEKWNGIQVGVLHHKHWFQKPVDPYVKPGDPSSGLLPQISAAPPGKRGDGDQRIQAYCFRMCLTNADENRIPFAKPANYDAAQYELLRRVFATGWRETFEKFDRMPNRKTDTNNHGPFSTDFIGNNYDYPDASYERRREIISAHEQYQKGLMYFLANDPGVPTEVRQEMSRWGLPKDEFKDNGGWPHQIYVREARRMIGQYVMTEHDCFDTRDTPDSVGMGSYTLDSHNCQRYVRPDGTVQNEGDIGVKAPYAYEIAYGSLTPKQEQCENLLVPVCVSSSHIAFGSIRMEPVFMILGQSAATAACLSIDRKVAVQNLPYPELREQLLRDKQVLKLKSKKTARSNREQTTYNSRNLPGIVIDDADAKTGGEWTDSTSLKPYVNWSYQHDGNSGKGEKSIAFSTTLKPGHYEVRLSYNATGNRATNVPVVINHLGGRTTKTVNQKKDPEIKRLFTSLGTYEFSGTARVTISNTDTDGYVIADAVQFVEVKKP